ncbi:TIGR00341 family protein [Flammeovirgaceae bacterium SG7u.111]|nr:TIGR00341 family protein [Flammeovirgaceae bacterium SG7u.132]WPO35437.1 TIGR00341 family protein [Flammeovirgaceae bacterium SG7u.111]
MKRIKALVREIWKYNKEVMGRIANLADDTDIEGTINGIRSQVVLEGSNLWILICSTFIACIGLDTNSPAVIIGAMLISPLMSPILGIGLSVGINDRDTLLKSFRNFLVAIGLSLLVSMIYFKITPFGGFTDEMRARTEPTILDAFVAFFGGLAGIIAGSRTNKTNAIPGVAIATALMPPLCTSGFGLVTGRLEVFGGAFYLFFINAVLICMSTYAIVRILKFPLVEVPDPKMARKATRFVYFFLTILLIPSFIFLYNSLKNITRTNIITTFISENIHFDVEKGTEWNYEDYPDSLGVLKVYYFGQYIRTDSVEVLETKLKGQLAESLLLKMSAPKITRIELTPTDAPPDEEKKLIKEEIVNIKSKLVTMEQIQKKEVDGKVSQVDSLKNIITFLQKDTIPFLELKEEIKALYPELDEFTISKATQTAYDSSGIQQVYMGLVKWNKKVTRTSDKKNHQERLLSYLKVKLNSDKVQLVDY